jgi:Transposase DDE domain
MKFFAYEIMEKLTKNGETLILIIDQTKISEHFECLMISLRFGERALPLAFIVKKTKGAIGFEEQKSLLDQVFGMIPEGANIILMADRFYGTAALIDWCQQHNWGYRIRLKNNLIIINNNEELKTGELATYDLNYTKNVRFNNSNVRTNIGVIHENSHKESWIIAMDTEPNNCTILDYGLRWGTESMFSDFKSRGFDITTTKLIHEDRIERLILIASIALYWSVSMGMQPLDVKEQEVFEKLSKKKF